MKLRVNVNGLREDSEYNWQDEIIAPEKSKNIVFRISNELLTNDGNLDFEISLRIPKEKFSTSVKAKDACLSWCKNNFSKEFSKCEYWNFFEIKTLDFTEITFLLEEDINEYSQMEFEIFISDTMNKNINNSIEHLKPVKATFKKAKEKLTELAFHSTSFGFNHSLGEARIYFYEIERILECSADTGGGTPSNIRSALKYYEELARRKVENNHNYQVSLQNLQRIIFRINFPRYWRKKPNL
jgi:hypothetical protein